MKIRLFLSLIILPLAVACGPEVEPEIPVFVIDYIAAGRSLRP